jgi:HEAT repeat protein
MRLLCAALAMTVLSPGLALAQHDHDHDHDHGGEDPHAGPMDEADEEPWTFERCVAGLAEAAVETRRRALLELTNHVDACGPLVPKVLALVGDADEDVRFRAVYLLGCLGSGAAEAVPTLVKLVLADDRALGSIASEALGQIGGTSAVAPLVGALGEGAAERRALVAFTLGRLGPPAREAATPGLLALTEHEDPRPRAAAVFALARVEAPEATARALRALEDAEPNVRMVGCDALVQLEASDEVALALAKALERERDENARAGLARGLVAMGDRAGPAVPALVAALDDPDPMVQECVLAALGNVGPAAAPALTRLVARLEAAGLEPHTEEWTVLVRIGAASAPAVAKWVGHAHRDVRAAAARALAAIGPGAREAALEAVGEALGAEVYPEVQHALVQARASLTGEVTPDEAVDAIDGQLMADDEAMWAPFSSPGVGPRTPKHRVREGGAAKTFTFVTRARSVVTEPLVRDWAALEAALAAAGKVEDEDRRAMAIEQAWHNHAAPAVRDLHLEARRRLVAQPIEALAAHFGEPLFLGDLVITDEYRGLETLVVGERLGPDGAPVLRLIDPYRVEYYASPPSYLRYPTTIPSLDFWDEYRVDFIAVDHAFALEHVDEQGVLTIGERRWTLPADLRALLAKDDGRQLYVHRDDDLLELRDRAEVDRSPPLEKE